MIYKCLECGGSITESEEYNSGFEESHWGNESSFPLILFLNADVVVSPLNVKFSKQCGLLHILSEFWDEGKRIGVVDGMGVQVMVVLAWMQCSSFFGIKKKGEAWSDFDGTICPVLRCSLTKVLQVSISVGLREYTLAIFGMKSGLSSMV